MPSNLDAVVVGSGPNGLAAAIAFAERGRSVRVIEAEDTIGGACRSAPLTLPGFVHDVGSAIHPLAVASPFFRRLPLHRHGLEWVHPPVALAHPFDDGTAAVLEPSLPDTARTLDACDHAAWPRLMHPLVRSWEALSEDILRPLLHVPRHPLALARFGSLALLSARALARLVFRGPRARALFAGLAAHAVLPLEAPASSAAGLVLGALGHAVGWPFPRGGAGTIVAALAAHLDTLGGTIDRGSRVTALSDIPRARATLLDLAIPGVLAVTGSVLPAPYQRALRRFAPGPGVFKVDWALDAPIPWKAPACARAACVHLGGTLEEISASERACWQGVDPDVPFVILAQPTLFDPTRAPAARHVAWAYCHVPHASRTDTLTRLEAQVERFAPGFSRRILARHVATPQALERGNANLAGGDITGGANTLWQLLARPVLSPTPYATPAEGLFICSSSTPPGGGVHGMCGWGAARLALR